MKPHLACFDHCFASIADPDVSSTEKPLAPLLIKAARDATMLWGSRGDAWRRGPGDATGIIQVGPLVFPTTDQVCEQPAGNGPVDHPADRVAGGDIDVGFVQRVWTNEGQTIKGFPNLT